MTVRSTRNIHWSNKTPILTVSTPALSRLRLSGAGTFTAHDPIVADSFALRLDGAATGRAELDVGSLSVEMSGAGDFELSGKAGSAKFDLAGAGKVDALSLKTADASINLAGVGTVRVSCSDSLSIKAGGMGTIEYRGDPKVELDKGGLVSVRKVD